MATIAAADVKKLRDLTAAGMMECKKALEESDGDFDKAIEILRISGAAKAAKRGAERETSNGLVAANDGQIGDSAALMAATMSDGRTVEQGIGELAGIIGEKLELGRVAVLKTPVATYLHRRSSDLPPQVGVMVSYEGSEEAARGAAMQVAAMRPAYVSRDDVPSDVVENERRIAEATAKEEGKPDAALPKIVEGRVQGFFKDAVLLEQPSVQDSKQSVAAVLQGAGTTVTAFARFEVGQG